MLIGKNISYARGASSLFNDISFILEKEQTIIVRGKNGSGKSTLLRLLTGLIRPQPQTLFWKEEEITANNLPTYQQSLLYVGHKLALHPEALVKDQTRLWRDHYGISEKAIEEALNVWGVSSFINKKVTHLSQGQQKRLSLSRCSWLDRPLWILDEPQAGLDQEGKITLTKILQEYLKKGGMVIQATHEEDPAQDGIRL